jgi:hypothetical protein
LEFKAVRIIAGFAATIAVAMRRAAAGCKFTIPESIRQKIRLNI